MQRSWDGKVFCFGFFDLWPLNIKRLRFIIITTSHMWKFLRMSGKKRILWGHPWFQVNPHEPSCQTQRQRRWQKGTRTGGEGVAMSHCPCHQHTQCSYTSSPLSGTELNTGETLELSSSQCVRCFVTHYLQVIRSELFLLTVPANIWFLWALNYLKCKPFACFVLFCKHVYSPLIGPQLIKNGSAF